MIFVLDPAEKTVCDLLDHLGIAYTRRAHPAVFTVEQARRYDPENGGLHCKNLFLRNKKGDGYFLAIFEQSAEVNLRDLGARLGAGRLSLASAERLERVLAVSPGAVGPFGLINDRDKLVEVLLDARLREAPSLGFHPNVNTSTLQISAAGLLQFLAHCGSRVRWIE
jgi:Ala-tRNA(Pro) deacylase